VALAGDGGDPLLLPSTVPRQLGRAPALDVVRGVSSLLWRYRRVPLFGLRTRLRRRAHPTAAALPAWFSTALLRTYDPHARRREVEAEIALEGTRPEALQRMRAAWWPSMFEGLHPAVTGQPVEIRYPFFDRRVIALGLALPSYPWCIDKIVLREAMAGMLPESVRWRPKTPLPVDSVAIRPRWTVEQATSVLAAAPGIERFIDVRRFAAAVHPDRLLLDSEPGTLAAVSLAVWLTHAPALHEASARDVRVASA
jgi:asparagine synthase (glutamine-hydrolysing)